MKLALTVDLGNSAAKLVAWSLADRPRLQSALRIDSGDNADPKAAQRIAEWLPEARFEAAWICSVAEEPKLQRLLAALRARPSPVEPRQPEHGLSVDLPHPEKIGRDRLFAARGAFELGGVSALVLDAGTALTVDALEVRAGRARFLGGAIAPGPRLLSSALAQGAAALFEVQPRIGAPALGRDTRSALESGVTHGFRGAARELVHRLGAECGLERAPIWLCGGARALLEDPELFPGHKLRVEPDLVHCGLLAAGACRA